MPTTFHGNCHCAAFKFSATFPDGAEGLRCDCSHCSRTGVVWVWTKDLEVTIERGAVDDLGAYEFANKRLDVRVRGPACAAPARRG
jgi:hypothetical protein